MKRTAILGGIAFFLMIFSSGCNNVWRGKTDNREPLPRDERGYLWQLVDRGNDIGERVPAAGEDAQMTYDSREHRFILYGGKNDEDENLAETWFYYPAENRWEKLTQSVLNPPPREDHVLLYDSLRHCVILHGGENGDTSNELWELNLHTMQWINKTDSLVPYLEDHTAVYVAKRKGAFFFGGQNEQHPALNDLWFLNLDPDSPDFYRWKRLDVGGKKHPKPRTDAQMVYDRWKNRLLIYGGWNKEEDVFTNDTWAYLFHRNKWKRLSPKSKRFYPPSRRHFGATLDSKNRYWVIFGGKAEGGPVNDIWAFDLTNDRWINLTPGPAPRMDHHLLYDPVSGNIYLYGGDRHIFKDPHKLHDVWKIRLEREKKK